MTAEIAILNRSAVALAADSAVTISGPKGEKIYNTANKLFNLSKYHPVGIMVYSNADFMGVPWETIIKAYREKVNLKNIKDTIHEQGMDFIDYLKNNHDIFTKNIVEDFKEMRIFRYFNHIKKRIENKVTEETNIRKNVNVNNIINEEIEFQKNWFLGFKYHNNFTDADFKKFFSNNKRIYVKLRGEVFQQIPFSRANIRELLKTLFAFMFKDHPLFRSMTGIVITGFGNSEYLPSIIDFEVHYIIDGDLLYKINNDDSNISGSLIMPYAQPDMVHTFIKGINPDLYNSAYSALNKMFNKISDDFKNIPQIKKLRKANKIQITENIKLLHTDNLKSFFEEFEKTIKLTFIDPVVMSISSLPKEELAAVAESLVYLTFLRKRMSDEPETVGGDIDVAVISKGDGFIWIKRKHYFKSELNPHFIKNYFK